MSSTSESGEKEPAEKKPAVIQGSENSIKERVSTLLNSSDLADVFFIITKDSEVHKFPAHKFVLAAGSTVFRTMFYGKFPEKSNEIEITDIEPAEFLALLRFLYADVDNVHIMADNVKELIYAARKYDVTGLEKYCVDYLNKEISIDTVSRHLRLALWFGLPDLQAACLEFFDSYAEDIFATDRINDLSLDELSLILERDTLHITEMALFLAVVRWSEVECQRKQMKASGTNQRLILGNTLKLIRFPIMRLEIYVSQVAPLGILTDEEELSVLRYLTFPSNPKSEFSDTPRVITDEIHRVVRFTGARVESGVLYIGTQSRFTVNREVYLIGYTLPIWGKDHAESNISIKLTESADRIVLARNAALMKRAANTDVFDVKFKKPVKLRANTEYTTEFTSEVNENVLDVGTYRMSNM